MMLLMNGEFLSMLVELSPNVSNPAMIEHQRGFINFNVLDDLRTKINSQFYTIDVAEKENGQMVILEVGDGQVSGLSPNQQQLKFYSNLYI